MASIGRYVKMIDGQAQLREGMALLAGSPERIDLAPLGGVAFPPA